jgi:DNA-directed RNA polymerase subunit RPC12/RpoP
MSKKPKPVFELVKREQQELRFADLAGDTYVLRLGEGFPDQPGMLCLGEEDTQGLGILLDPKLAEALAEKLQFYAATGRLTPLPKKQEWLVCPRCGKKRYRERVQWVEGDMKYLGPRCSACGYTVPLYVMGFKKKV